VAAALEPAVRPVAVGAGAAGAVSARPR
jgi:hypothetical protein